MKQENVKLYLSNFHNQGELKDLPKYVKTKEITFKKSNVTKAIKYYHWFIIEMFFSMQGGTHEVLNHVKAIETRMKALVPNGETGEIEEKEQVKTALFCEIKLNWQGEELIELYPIFDSSNSKVILNPDAQDLNNSYKRGLVRGIARISGIGGDRFGDYDDQFGGDGDEGFTPGVKEKEESEEEKEKREKAEADLAKAEAAKAKKEAQKKAKAEAAAKAKAEAKAKKEEVEEPSNTSSEIEEPKDADDFVKDFLEGAEIDTSKKEKKSKPKDTKVDEMKKKKKEIAASGDDYGQDTEEYADLLLYVKREQKKKGLSSEVKKFIKSKGKDLFSELTYLELTELKELLDL